MEAAKTESTSTRVRRQASKAEEFAVELCYRYNCSLCIFASAAVLALLVVALFVNIFVRSQFVVGEREQSVAASGRLVCCDVARDEPKSHRIDVGGNGSNTGNNESCYAVPYTTILLYDYNWIATNELMNHTTSDRNGYFEVAATTESITKLDPFLLINHKCNREHETLEKFSSQELVLMRQSKYLIPQHFVNNGTYHIMPLNLHDYGWRDLHFVRFVLFM